MNSAPPNELQLDALRELANIGCGQAANSLSRLLGNLRVDLSVPRVVLASSHEAAATFATGGGAVVAAKLGLEGELRGRMLFLLPPAEGAALEALLLGGEGMGSQERDSAVSEAANIVASACLTALGKMVNWRLLPTVPVLQRGPARDVISGAVAETEGEAREQLVLEARFSVATTPVVAGQILLVLERASALRMLQRLGV